MKLFTPARRSNVCKNSPKHSKYLLPSLKTFLLSFLVFLWLIASEHLLSLFWLSQVSGCQLSSGFALLHFIYLRVSQSPAPLSGSSPLRAGAWKIDILTRWCQTLLIELQAPLESPACLAATLPPLINTCWYFRYFGPRWGRGVHGGFEDF